MPDRWQTYAIEFKGGLITNMSPLQHGINAPGSARILRNYEPSIEGGYRSIQGYDKYDPDIVPPYGAPLVHGGSQTGTTLVVGNIYTEPAATDVFSLAGGAVDGAAQTGTSASSRFGGAQQHIARGRSQTRSRSTPRTNSTIGRTRGNGHSATLPTRCSGQRRFGSITT